MKNKTNEVKVDWETELMEFFDKKYPNVERWKYEGFVNTSLKHIKKNFVAKGEVREMIEDIQATEIADHSLASLIEKLHKYKKSLE